MPNLSCLWLWSNSPPRQPPAFQIDTPGQKLEMSRKYLNPVKRYPSREFLWPGLLREHFQKRHNKCLLTQARAPTRDQSEGFTKASLREQMICLACLQSRGRWEVIYKIIPDTPKSQITGNPHSSTNDGFLQKHRWMSPISTTLHRLYHLLRPRHVQLGWSGIQLEELAGIPEEGLMALTISSFPTARPAGSILSVSCYR